MIDARECASDKISDKTQIEKAIRKIAQLSKMQIIHGPVIVEGRPHNPGLTGFAIIDYSHISIHTFPTSRILFVDVFSCKRFNATFIIDFIKTAFQLDETQISIMQFGLG
jgi:S-adenosylmethionine decarboxylase